jgi:hypothetical protein
LTTDYATMPENGAAAASREDRNAELVLSKITDRLVMTSRTSVLILTAVALAGQVYTGAWLRTFLVPRGWQVTAAWALLVILGLAAPYLIRRPRSRQPQWARAADAHQRSLPGRVPDDMLAMLRRYTASMTSGTRWHGDARIYIAPCTQQDETHFAACCTGGTIPLHGRLLVVLGEHLAMGPVPVAKAVLAHERRHISGWRLHLFALAAISGTWGLIIAGWTVPWPAALLPAAALRIAHVCASWLVEISCDIGSAREAGTAAMLAAVDFKERTEGRTRAALPPAKRWAHNALRWTAGPEHPPYSVRRWAIRAFA